MRKTMLAALALCLASGSAIAQDKEPNACEIGALASRAAVDLGPRLTGEDGDRLSAEMARLAEHPCDDTPLYLKHPYADMVIDGEMIFKEDWYLTCDGCAAIPARHVFPTATLLLADTLDLDTVSIEVLRMQVRECPFKW